MESSNWLKKNNWKNFYNYIEDIIDYFEILVNLLKIVNNYKEKLENNIIIKNNIFDFIIKLLNLIIVYI